MEKKPAGADSNAAPPNGARPMPEAALATPLPSYRPVSRRRAERLRIPECILEVTKPGWFGLRRTIAAELVDVSETGIGLRLKRPVATGAKLHVVVRITVVKDSLEGEAEVRWRRQDGDSWLAGAEFVSVPGGQSMKIRCLRRLMTSLEWKQRLATQRRSQSEAGSGLKRDMQIIRNLNT